MPLNKKKKTKQINPIYPKGAMGKLPSLLYSRKNPKQTSY